MTFPARRFLLLLACSASTEAATLALYATPTSTNGTNAAGAVPNLATVTALTGVGLTNNGTAIATRDAFGASQYVTGSSPAAAGGTAGSNWLWNNNQNWTAGGTPVSGSHYFQFSLTAAAGSQLDLSTLSFNWQAAINNSALGNTFSYQVFYSTDGTNYNALGSVGTKLVGNDLGASVTDWGTISAESVDLSGIADISTVTFRIAEASSTTTTTGSFAFFYQNISVNGDVVPEPSAALLGSLGLLALLRRRR